MFSRRSSKKKIVCNYLSFTDPATGEKYRLPLVHIRIKHGNIALKTDALVDSGATATFIPLELAEVLGFTLPQETQTVTGAGGKFSACVVKVDLLQVVKGVDVFCEFKALDVLIPTVKGVIPHSVLGRDTIFKHYDIIFRESIEQMVFKWLRK